MTIFSIPPHAKFLDLLAQKVLDGTLLGDWDRSGPFWLSDVTIILPTRRARLELAQAFARHAPGLLPDIRTFGGEVEDEEPFLPPFEAAVLPDAASALERRLVLSRLVAAWAATPDGKRAFSTPPTAGEILSMAESLGRLIDDLAIEERSQADLRAIAPMLDADLGEYWQQTLQFLDIALTFWPERLADSGRADGSALRNLRLDRQAQTAPLLYGTKPVIAAGSTGSIPATARLLKAIAGLPRGALVLPGLDTSLTPATITALLDDTKNPHGHPQFGLVRLLHALGVKLDQVIDLAPEPASRTTMLRHALALTDDTALWSGQRLDSRALEMARQGLSIIQARTEDEEARAIALAARQGLFDRKSVGIVTPDRNLARRIAAELKRFDIWVDDAAGAPLFQSASGRLARQILALLANHCAAVDLIALLRNRAALFGLDRADVSRLADDIELGLLRGQRPGRGIVGLRLALKANIEKTIQRPARWLDDTRGAAIEDLFVRIEAAIAPLLALGAHGTISASQFAVALHAAFVAVADGADLPGRRELDDWAAQLAGHSGEGHHFPPSQLDDVLAALMLGLQVRTAEQRRSDIAIWGTLEARLMNPDLLILAGLNEDVWPEPADPGPWLSRGMRLAAGLEPPERKQGLAAHDFAQGMGNAEVIIALSDRIGSSPALPSRLVQRLEAFAGKATADALRATGAEWIAQARRLDAVDETRPATRPLPNPLPALRPRQLSVTEIETLMRSPYDLYAKHVLRLRPLDPLGEAPDARERGTIIHDIFAQFVIDKHDVMAPDAMEILRAIASQKFAGLDAIGERRDIWLRRFETAAAQFLDYERERNPLVRQRHAEIDGTWSLHLSEAFTLIGRADRVDELADGTLEIIDFKTGSPPSVGAMKAFEVPQLLLEAQMGKVGALAGIAGADSSALTYIKIGLGPDAFIPKGFSPAEGFGLMDAADEISRRMQGHIALFLFNDTPMPARLLPLPGQRFAGAYDHLARVAEWTATDGEEGAP